MADTEPTQPKSLTPEQQAESFLTIHNQKHRDNADEIETESGHDHEEAVFKFLHSGAEFVSRVFNAPDSV